jgi:NAD(P)-dependent dehydrogenase (short-subunit alcohol dehydrogenase family)
MSRTIVITGCSSGFGKLAAERLARGGDRVYATMREISGRNAPKAKEIEAIAKEKGLDIRVIELDVTSTESVNAAAARVSEESGGADVVINNAGQMFVGITECFDEQELTRQLDINVVGVHRMNRAFLPTMRAQSSGLVINISSIAGRIAIPFFGVYHASKWALEGYSHALRYELATSGVDVVLIEPGPFSTELFGTSPAPVDADARTTTYVPVVPETLEQMSGGFGAMFENPEVPTDPMIVVERMVELIEMEPGTRPFRSVCGVDFDVGGMNAACDPYQSGVVEAMGICEFATIKA